MRKKRRPALSVDVGVCISMLFEAAEVAGGAEELARQLRVPFSMLSGWMEGLEAPSQTAYQRTLELLRRDVPA